MADDAKPNGETPEQQIRNALDGYDASSAIAKNFLALAEKINRFCPQNDIDNLSKGLKFRIELLKKTPETILLYNFSGENKKYFSEIVVILKEYKEYYWSHIKYEFCENISGSTRKSVAEEAFKIIYEINEILKYHNRIEIDNPALLTDGHTHPDYEANSNRFKSTVDSGKQKLEFIIPLFSVWGGGRN